MGLRRIYGPERDERITVEWRKLHNEELKLFAPGFFFNFSTLCI